MAYHQRQEQPFLSKMEEAADNCLRQTKGVLPHLGRICLTLTFIEDGFRMCTQWGEQKDYISSTWRCGAFLASCFVLINLIGQIGCSLLVICRKHVNPACYFLFFIIFLQTIAYSILWDIKFLARSLSLVGAVLLLMAENHKDKNVFTSMPSLNSGNQKKDVMQLGGRLLLVLMFLSLLKFKMTGVEIVRNIIGIGLIGLVTIGFKTKLMSVVMISWLMIMNVTLNDFWRHRSASIMYDFKKYDFFQSMTVIGGLIILIVTGPGGLAYDKMKKMY